jgi:hypothetical protein
MEETIDDECFEVLEYDLMKLILFSYSTMKCYFLLEMKKNEESC